MNDTQTQDGHLLGLITEADLALAEDQFPGITHFYEAGRTRSTTFLELVTLFGAFQVDSIVPAN